MKPVSLTLPPAHSYQQFKLINGWECRYNPAEPELNPKFDPENPTPFHPELKPPAWSGVRSVAEINAMPMMFPGLRFIVGACGTKFGKTFGCATAISKRAWNKAGSINWWVAPSYDQADMAMEEVKQRLPRGLWREQVAKHRITLYNPDGTERSWIQFKTAENPDLLRGAKVSFYVIDEAARNMPYESFKSVMTTVTQTYGQGIIISTPNGRGWFHDIYQRGIKRAGRDNSKWPEWFSLRMPTWVNPHVPMQSILDAKRNLPADAFQQEYEARFLEGSAGVFRNVERCVAGVLKPYIPGHSYVLGVDLARIRDWTVLTVMDRMTHEVVYFERFNKIDWPLQMSRIIQVAREYRAAVIMDSTGIGDPIQQTLEAMGLIVEGYKISGGVGGSKKQLIDNLRVNIEQGRISYPYIPELIDELERYQYKQTASGNFQFEAPEGYHDDCVISLALACWLAAQEPFVYRFYSARGV